MRAVNHQHLRKLLLPQRIPRSTNALGIKVGAARSTAQNHEAVLVSTCPGNGSETLLGHTHEVVLCGGGANGVDGNSQAAISAVLEANGERETGSKLTVQLGLSGACSDGAEGDEIREKLRGDGVEHLRGNGHARGCEVNVELAGDAEALVDLVALIDIRVVDQTLPADCSPGLLEVGAHNDEDVVLELVGERLEALAVLNGSLGVVNRARSDHDQETVILLCDDLCGLLAALDDSLLGVCWDGELVAEKSRGDERIIANDWIG